MGEDFKEELTNCIDFAGFYVLGAGKYVEVTQIQTVRKNLTSDNNFGEGRG